MKLPTSTHVWLGLALVVGIAGLTIGGVIAALYGSGPSDGMVTAVTSMLSAIIGGLVGYSAASNRNDKE